MGKRVAAVVLTAAALLLVGSVAVPPPESGSTAAMGSTVSTVDSGPLATIGRLQQRLHDVPGDWSAWAALGLSYLEQARITADPSYYQRSEGSLRESLRLHPSALAIAGLGALANARHDFAEAARLAREALADNAFSAQAYGVLADALTQLGQTTEATDAIQHMLDLDPGLPALSRAAYDLEQHGNAGAARELWQRALHDASGANATFVHQQLGDLAWHAGDLATARAEYTIAGYGLGLARADLVTGHADRALGAYAAVAQSRPSPSVLVEYTLVLRGDFALVPDLRPVSPVAPNPSAAQDQLRLAEAALRLLQANGGRDDLAAAEVAIAHGDYAAAVTFCEREWQRRKHSDVADLLGWSLHLAGRDPEALTFARRALSLGISHRGYQAHLHAIEESLK
jgi:tetratricopeptide (TPR) repeat protein